MTSPKPGKAARIFGGVMTILTTLSMVLVALLVAALLLWALISLLGAVL